MSKFRIIKKNKANFLVEKNRFVKVARPGLNSFRCNLSTMAAVPSAQLSLQERDELLCTYASLILHDEKLEISAENISKVLAAAGAKVETYWPSLFARAVASAKIGDLLQAVGTPGAAAAPAAAASPSAKAADKAAPKEEKKEEEEDADMGFSLFD